MTKEQIAFSSDYVGQIRNAFATPKPTLQTTDQQKEENQPSQVQKRSITDLQQVFRSGAENNTDSMRTGVSLREQALSQELANKGVDQKSFWEKIKSGGEAVLDFATTEMFGGDQVGKAIQNVWLKDGSVFAKGEDEHLAETRELYQNMINKAREEGDEAKAEKIKEIAQKSLDNLAKNFRENQEERYVSPTQILADAGEIGVDLATMGTGTTGKTVAKTGLKIAGKNIGKKTIMNTIKMGGEAAVMNALNSYSEDEDLEEAVKSAGTGFAMGVSLPVLGNLAIDTVKGAYKLGKKGVHHLVTPKAKLALEKVDNSVNKYYEKAVVPQFRGANKTPKMRAKYKANAKQAVQEIVANKENLVLLDEMGDMVENKIPRNLQQFEQAVSQTKRKIFEKYSKMSRKAGKIMINNQKIITNIQEIVNDKRFTFHPEVKASAKKYLQILNEESFDVLDAEKILTTLNSDLKAFYNKQGNDTAGNAFVKHVLANNIRDQINKAVAQSGGEYAKYKKAYGALSAIEKDVTHRALVEGRKAPQGFFALGDVLTIGDLASGALGNPVSLVKGAAGLGLNQLNKFLNNKNRMIREMFEGVDEGMEILMKHNDDGAKISRELGGKIKTGKFGEIYTQFKGKAKEAVAFLMKKRGGIAEGVFTHKKLGEIDLPWGRYDPKTQKGVGLVKILKKHPEVKISELQQVIDDSEIIFKSDRKVRLKNIQNNYITVLGKEKDTNHWIITSFQKLVK